ncbi:MAG: hypothetical protein U5O39_20335 [Gammaproteobacteria bacterium]|nr:hypothetical protein [Gammaproteobacteria bacterium]
MTYSNDFAGNDTGFAGGEQQLHNRFVPHAKDGNPVPCLIETDYHDAKIAVEIDDEERACLRVNGLVRESADAGAGHRSLRLSSTLQTGYEWHEFIEVVIEFLPETIDVSLCANRQEIASNTYFRMKRT